VSLAPPGFVTVTVRAPNAASRATTRRTVIAVAATDFTAVEMPLPRDTFTPLAKPEPWIVAGIDSS
jgi:hypothetical protein